MTNTQVGSTLFEYLHEKLLMLTSIYGDKDASTITKFAAFRDHAPELLFLLLRRIVILDHESRGNGEAKINEFTCGQLPTTVMTADGVTPQKAIRDLLPTFHLSQSRNWFSLLGICSTFDTYHIIQSLVVFDPYRYLVDDIHLVTLYGVIKQLSEQEARIPSTIDQLAMGRAMSSLLLLAHIPTYYGQRPLEGVKVDAKIDQVTRATQVLVNEAANKPTELHPKAAQDAVEMTVYRQEAKVFYFEETYGALYNSSDERRNVAFKASTFINTMRGVLAGIQSDNEEKTREQRINVLKQAGRSPGYKFGCSSLRSDKDFQALGSAKEKIDRWFDFDRGAGFGVFSFVEELGDGTDDAYAPFSGMAFREALDNPDYVIGGIFVANNFLTLKAEENDSASSDLLSWFMAGYMEGVLTAILTPLKPGDTMPAEMDDTRFHIEVSWEGHRDPPPDAKPLQDAGFDSLFAARGRLLTKSIVRTFDK